MRLQRGKRTQIGVEAPVLGRGLNREGALNSWVILPRELTTEISMQDCVKKDIHRSRENI